MNEKAQAASHSSLVTPHSSFTFTPGWPTITRNDSRGFSMTLFRCLKWPEMRGAALELIARVREGHARGSFHIPVVDFLRVFSPGADAAELSKVAERGDLQF